MIQINNTRFIGLKGKTYNDNLKKYVGHVCKTYINVDSIKYFYDEYVVTDKEDFHVFNSAEEIMDMIDKSTRFIDN